MEDYIWTERDLKEKEDIHPYPFVLDKIPSDCDDSEFIISSEMIDFDISEPDGEWASITYCSPVLAAWGRWNLEIRHSVDQALSTFSGNKARIEQIIDFMKGRIIKVTSEDLFGLIRLADILQVDELYTYCKDRIENIRLTKENFYKVLQACTLYGFEHEHIDEFIRCNLTELCKETSFLQIDAASVEMLLTEEELTYWSMQSRFEVITDWCKTHGTEPFFERWFDFLDLSKIDENFLKKIVVGGFFVRIAPYCLKRIRDHLSSRQNSLVPYVFILDDIRTGSNVTGLNLEDMHLYRFHFPDTMMDTMCVPRMEVTGEVLAFNRSKRCIYAYNINNEICTQKRIVCRGKYPNTVSHILEINEGFVIIEKETFATFDCYPRDDGIKLKNHSVLYQTVSDNGKVIKIEPIMSVAIVVSCVCYSHPMIVMSTSTYSKTSNLYVFNLQSNTMMIINLPNELKGVKCLLPVYEEILVVTCTSSIILSINKITGDYNVKDGPHLISLGNPKYLFVHDTLIELNSRNSRNVYLYKSKKQCYFKEPQLQVLNRLNFDHLNQITCGYVKRTLPVCHMLCPHCDPNAKAKEREQKRREEEERNRIKNQAYNYDSDHYYDSDDYYDDFRDDYYDVYDDPWNQREMIWDGSAEEFVEAWW